TAERFGLLDDSLRELQRSSRRSMLSALPGVLGLSLTVQAIFTALLVLGTYLALNGAIGPAEVLAILVLATRCADPLLSLGDLGGQLRGARAELAKLDTLLRTPPLPEPHEPIEPARHDLEFDSVTFRHGDRTVIDGLSLALPEGRRLAVVGPSGAGKSTLLQLLARFHDVDTGAIRIGGTDVRAVDTQALMARIAIVFQEVYLFDGTIEDNIRLGRADATEAEVRAAATLIELRALLDDHPGLLLHETDPALATGKPSLGTPSPGAPSPGAPSPGAPSPGAPSSGGQSPYAPSSGTPSSGTPSPGAPSSGALSEAAESALAWIESHGDVRAAARRLGVHPNTLRYRVRKLAADGLDLSDPHTRLVTWLRLRLL
ncbi:ATP-binding cassette domain-containing protein, partial [Streptosporangium algeriense]